MKNDFMISESLGDKLYKLIFINLSEKGMMKIISKESKTKKIHFIIRLAETDPHTYEILTEETKYKSIESGVTKRQFNNMIKSMSANLPQNVGIMIHDLSDYSSLIDQFSAGIVQGIFNISKDIPD